MDVAITAAPEAFASRKTISRMMSLFLSSRCEMGSSSKIKS